MKQKTVEMGRRDFLRQGAAIVGGAVTATAMAGPAPANQHPHPHEGSLDYLDRNSYSHNMEVHGQVFAGTRRGGRIQFMAIGERRFLVQQSEILEVTDPLNPVVVSQGQFQSRTLQLAFSQKIKRWILLASSRAESTSSTQYAPNGKYDDPSLIGVSINAPGLRGIRIHDLTDPENVKLVAKWSADRGDPEREIQTGGGCSHNFYDGGRYAYLDASFDNSFIHMESPVRHYTHGLQIIDIEDPSNPKWVSNWWVKGQRAGEEADYRKWRGYGDHKSFTCKNGSFYVPRRVEDGGRLAYSTWGSFGFMIHDVSDPAHPRMIGRFRPPYIPGGIQMYATDISKLDRGFVVANPEVMNPDCSEPWQEVYVLDVRDPTKPTPISTLPVPTPPAEAPYDDYCNKRGRFGPRNPPNQKAPGRPDANFTCYSYFNAGVQCFDLSDPAKPRISAYFVPPQGGDLHRWNSYNRTVDVVFVEWDRKLIWVGADTGLYLVSTPALGKPVLGPKKVEEWSIPGLNAGHDSA